MIVLVSKVLNRTVAVAFKYIKKTKHRSDILNGLNIMQNLAMQVTHCNFQGVIITPLVGLT